MARIAGRNGRLYANITSGGTPEPIAFLSNWSIDFTGNPIEVTAFGDTTKTYVSGLADASGDYSGFYDDATSQFFTAAIDSVARKMYLYPSLSTPGQYFWGTALFDFTVNGDVDGAVAISGSWNAASPILKVG